MCCAALVAASIVAGCGGGGGEAVAPDPAPDASTDVPAGAGASATALVGFLQALAARSVDDREPMRIVGFDPPRPETTEPEPLD